VKFTLFIFFFLPAVLIAQKKNSTFKGAIAFNVNTKFEVNKPYFTHVNYSLSLAVKKANVFSATKGVNFYTIDNSLLLGAHNNVFYQNPILRERLIDNEALDLFVGLTIEILRVIGTPQFSFCP
tara:strand:+ start:375 stop:746 length:372 start_codon:yes stop_codon:yes gene_type:complete